MITSDKFEQELQEALTRLYDPDYLPSKSLCACIGCNPQESALGVQAAIIHAIEQLEPPTPTPPGARTKLLYDLLYNRFVLKLTQEEVAENLHMSVATAWRGQREAIHALARLFWEHREAIDPSSDSDAETGRNRPVTESLPDTQGLDWRSQATHEIAALRTSSPNTTTDVARAIDNILELEHVLLARHDVQLDVRFVQANLTAAVHPSVVRQVLISAIGRLARGAPATPMSLFAGLEDGNVKITITSSMSPDSIISEDELVQGILTADDISVETHIDSGNVFLWVEMPSVNQTTVLVVDDNADVVDFYRRSAEGTNYRIVHVTEGEGLLAAVESVRPAIIVLDVMLPDVDGWRLLMRLHENPATRSIPVIICSVVREEQLALSLGAALYLSKPVRPQEFILALDQALPATRKEVMGAPADSEPLS